MIETGTGQHLVLPQWLPFKKAARLREATALIAVHSKQGEKNNLAAVGFERDLRNFGDDPNPFVASELMGIAGLLGREQEQRTLAEYVQKQGVLGVVPRREASRVLGLVGTDELETNVRIRSLKRHLGEFPSDAIGWIEQARLYTINSQLGHARKAVFAALHLAPGDRFIVRAAIRFLVHIGEWDAALQTSVKAYSLTEDPLILGPLISVGTHLNVLPNKMKPIAERAFDTQNVFIFSEVLEAIGTLETRRSALNRAKRFFKKAWMDPTKAVIGHSQWVLREHLPGLASEQKIDFNQSHEAMSWLKFAAFDIQGAMARSAEWALEEPYSRSPYILGSSAACVEERFTAAEEIASRGLTSNPKEEVLLNNLSFAQLRNGKLEAAERTFAPLRASLGNSNNIAGAGTYGLLLMMKGDYDAGAKQYRIAIRRATEHGNQDLVLYANLNFAISTMDVAKKLDVEILRASLTRLAVTRDPGCIGAALAIRRRIERSDLTGSDELSLAAKEFSEKVVKDRDRFLREVAVAGPI